MSWPNLNIQLLSAERRVNVAPELYATTKAHGLYNTFQFVLRLSPLKHRALAGTTPAAGSSLNFEQVQAMSTYLHETIHWWQHIGSTYGFIFGLSRPVQAHCIFGKLKQLTSLVGLKKSIIGLAHQLDIQVPVDPDSPSGCANFIVNNHFDLEAFRSFTFCNYHARQAAENYLFEAPGHSFHMTYGNTMHVLGSSVDPKFTALQNPDTWHDGFKKLRDTKSDGWSYGTTIDLWEIGALELFEGQARFGQIQYLYLACGKRLTWDDFKQLDMLSGVYVKAFQSFLTALGEKWPADIAHPIINLFLLVCDMAINPGVGFPFPIEPFFDSFLTDANPGARFMFLSKIVALKAPQLKNYILECSREEYEIVSTILARELVDYSPLEVSKVFSNWFSENGELRELKAEYESYDFGDLNYPIRHLFAHFLAFQQDKFSFPELFCWPGTCLAGPRMSDRFGSLFERHSALFVDKEEDDGVFPRLQATRTEAVVHQAYQRFYDAAPLYDLIEQWVTEDGPFKYNLSWLSPAASKNEVEVYMRRSFEEQFGMDPSTAELMQPK